MLLHPSFLIYVRLCICCIIILQYLDKYSKKYTKASRLSKFEAEQSESRVRPLRLFWRVLIELHRTMFFFTLKIRCKACFSQVTHQARETYDLSQWIIFKLISPQKHEVSVQAYKTFCLLLETRKHFSLNYYLSFDKIFSYLPIHNVRCSSNFLINCESPPIFNIKL